MMAMVGVIKVESSSNLDASQTKSGVLQKDFFNEPRKTRQLPFSNIKTL